jgi:uncharacterized protein (TIGR02265 family)
MEEPIVFGTSLRALFQPGLSRPLGPRALEQLKAAGLDLAQPIQPAYALATWVKVLAITAPELYPGEPVGRAYELLGRQVVQGLQRLRTGQARHEANVALGVARALDRMTKTFRVSNNYLETELQTKGPGHHLLELRAVPTLLAQVARTGLPPPNFYVGVFSETLVGWGAREVQVRLVSEDPARRAWRFEVRYAEG